MIIFAPAAVWGFSISPLKYLVTIDSGKKDAVAVIVKNNDVGIKDFKFKVVGARQDEAGRPIFGIDISPAEKWVTPDKFFATIKSNQREEINYLISVPKGTAPGAYNVGLVAEELGGGKSDNSVLGQLATLLTIQVAGRAEERIDITNWQAARKFLLGKSNVFNLVLNNTGNTQLPMGAILIGRDWLGREMLKEKILDKEMLMTKGERVVDKQILFSGDKFFFPGPYEMEVRVDFGLTNQTKTALVRVWYCPLWSLVAVLVFLLIIIWSLIRKFRKSHVASPDQN